MQVPIQGRVQGINLAAHKRHAAHKSLYILYNMYNFAQLCAVVPISNFKLFFSHNWFILYIIHL